MREITYALKPDLTPELKTKLCKACQWCCRYLLMRLPMVDDVFAQFYNAYGVEIETCDKGLLYGVIPHPCQQITEDGCKIYDKRPHICRIFGGGGKLEQKRCLWFNPVLDQPEVK